MIPNLLPLFVLGGYVGVFWGEVDSDIIIIAVIAMEILDSRARDLIGTRCLTHDQKTWHRMRKCLPLVTKKYSILSIGI